MSRVMLFGGPVLVEVKHLQARRRWLVFATCHRCGEPLGATLDSPTLSVTEAFLEDAIAAREMLAISVISAVERHVRRVRAHAERIGGCRCAWWLDSEAAPAQP